MLVIIKLSQEITQKRPGKFKVGWYLTRKKSVEKEGLALPVYYLTNFEMVLNSAALAERVNSNKIDS